MGFFMFRTEEISPNMTENLRLRDHRFNFLIDDSVINEFVKIISIQNDRRLQNRTHESNKLMIAVSVSHETL
jgi:hypothetical protein